MNRFGAWARVFGWLAGVAHAGCVFTPPPPLPEEADAAQKERDARRAAVRAGRAVGSAPSEGEGEAAPAAEFKKGDPPRLGMSEAEIKAYAIAQGDPEEGAFTLDEAFDGLAASGEVWIRIETGRGTMECKLHTERTPITVANFVGLARGLRPVLIKDGDREEWTTKRYYDGTSFHRVIPGFMIQGGDPLGTGLGNTGYVIADEIHPDLLHEEAGVLSMANRGPTTGSGQFFITLGPAHHLDGKHTVFGKCTRASVKTADNIALVPRGPDDKPTSPEIVNKITVERR